MHHLFDLAHEVVGARSRLGVHVQAVVGGARPHGGQLIDRGVNGAARARVQARVGARGDDAHHGGAGADIAVVVVLQADDIAHAERLLLGQVGVDGHLPGTLRQAPGRQGRALAERGHVLGQDHGPHGASELFGQIQSQDVHVLPAHRGHAVQGGQLCDDGVVQGPAALGRAGGDDDGVGPAQGQAGVGPHAGGVGVGDDEGEGDQGRAQSHRHQGRGGAAHIQQRGHVSAPPSGSGPPGLRGGVGPRRGGGWVWWGCRW